MIDYEDKNGEAGLEKYSSMTTDELEFELPLSIQRYEPKVMPCPDCEKKCTVTVTYEQEIFRSDSYGNNNAKRRSYEISYRARYGVLGTGTVLFKTGRFPTFREALIEAHATLDDLGIKK